MMEKSLILSIFLYKQESISLVYSFLDSVLPRNNIKLRRVCAQRSAYYIAPFHKLPGNIEEFLSIVFKEMLSGYKLKENLINGLMANEDFYIRDLFNELDNEKKGFINFLEYF